MHTIADKEMYKVFNHEDLYELAKRTLRLVRQYGIVTWVDFEDKSRLCISDDGKIWAVSSQNICN